MRSKLCGDIAQIIYELSECGVSPDMRRVVCTQSELPFHVMTHPDKEKAILIGLMTDVYDEQFVKAYTINFNRWNWAADEGFDLDEVFRTTLADEIFIDIAPHKVSSYFLS